VLRASIDAKSVSAVRGLGPVLEHRGRFHELGAGACAFPNPRRRHGSRRRRALTATFEEIPDATASTVDILDVAHTALVSQATSYGFKGGIDVAYSLCSRRGRPRRRTRWQQADNGVFFDCRSGKLLSRRRESNPPGK
jgi:hypothetical protein